MRVFLATTLLLVAPSLGSAQDAPEQLLPASAQVYLRWDGIDAHKKAFLKTGLGKMLQGDTGTFVTEMYNQFQQGLATILTVEELLNGTPPEELKKNPESKTGAALK